MRNKIVFLVLCLLLWCSLFSGCADEHAQLTILYINDLHGHLEEFKEHQKDKATVGGIARIATLVNQVRTEVESAGGNVMLLCAGDILQGTPMSLVFKGEPDIRAMNHMRFDAMVIGNHEFDYGQENLRRLMGLASFPIISANILAASTEKLAAVDYVVNSYGDLDVAVFGLTTDETPISTHPKNVRDLEFLPPIEIARELVPVLRGKADVVIALTHLGFEEDMRLAEEVPGIDVIVGGHSHTRLDSALVLGQTLICQAYEYGMYVGRADIKISKGHLTEMRSALIPVDNSVEIDPEIAELVTGYARRLGEELEKTVGVAVVHLEGERNSVRNRETNLGDLITDAMRTATGADVAITNGGSIRSSIDRGEITTKEILTALPFGGQLVTMNLTGRQIAGVLDRAANLSPGSGAFLQVSGVSYRMAAGKAKNVRIAGQPLDEKRSYRVATNDFLAAGGDGYTAFKQGTEYYNTGLKISDVVIDYIKRRGEVGKMVESRITRE